MSGAPAAAPLRGSQIWDHLRDESLEYAESTGTWPVSADRRELASHVAAFIETTMVPGTWNAILNDSGYVIRGELLPRWALLNSASSSSLVIRIAIAPLMGEIHMTTDTTPMLLLHTNVFVRQVASQRADE